MSKVRIIDLDREESSNWNETCLNNSLNVSFLAFQITRTAKLDCVLLAASQRTFCVQGACEGRKNKTACEFASFCMAVGPGFQAHIDNLLILHPKAHLQSAPLTDMSAVVMLRGCVASG